MQLTRSGAVRLIALGGLGEIGLNCLVIETERDAIVLDAGLMFPFESSLGFEYLIPNFSYLRSIKKKIRGYVLTHGHEDHIGALPQFALEVPAPAYGSKFTLALLKERLKDRAPKAHIPLHHVAPFEPIKLGNLRITLIPTSHSIVGARAVLIETPSGNILHSGDFKIDPTTPEESRFDPKVFADLGKTGIDLLLSDSTNILTPGHATRENEVAQRLFSIFQQATGRIIVGVFSSHIQRIQQVLDAAQADNRKVLLLGTSLLQNVDLARNMGYLKIPPHTLISTKQMTRLDPKKVCILSTGTQGEYRAILPRLAQSDLPDIAITPGDSIVLSTRIIPGNEHAIYTMVNGLAKAGAQVFYGAFSDIHSSGHACEDELRKLLELTKPKYFIPVHGEIRHLIKHAQIAQEMGVKKKNALVVENGDVIEWAPTGLVKKERTECGRIAVARHFQEPIPSAAVRERRSLAASGVVSVFLKGHSVADLKTLGLHLPEDSKVLFRELGQYLRKNANPRGPIDPGDFEKIIRRFFKLKTGKKPAILLFHT